jgi:hypothetical protein
MKKVLLIPVVVFIGIQFVRPERRRNEVPESLDFIAAHSPSPEIRLILTNACYDCHSNRTRYPWYSEVQPIAWWLNDHINEARSKLNFSEFGRLSPRRAAQKLDDCIDEIKDRNMPLPSYRLMHGDARLTQEQIDSFVAWLENTATHLRENAKG